MTHISHLPADILLEIFRVYLQTETQYDFVNCVSKVCRNWQTLCEEPSLWKEFDGTLPFDVLKEYCDKGILKNCKTLIFSKMRDLATAQDIETVYGNLPVLNSINFSNVMGTKCDDFFVELTGKCPKLQELVLNNKLHKYKVRPQIVCLPIHSCRLLKGFLRVRGADLVSLVFSNLYFPATVDLFWAVGDLCPNLEILKFEKMSHVNTISFPTAHIQSKCPKLRILCLGFPVTISTLGYGLGLKNTGFKNLEVFRNPSHLNYLFEYCAMDLILFDSQKLKELDISKCIFIKTSCLHSVKYAPIENLNISSGMIYNFSCCTELIQNWSQSLKVLNVSYITDGSLNDMFQIIISNGGLPNITRLNLKRTSITISTLKLILKNCPQLCVLNLECCSELKELSSMYKGETAIKVLLSILLSFND